jgi:hypothetical protein
MTSVMIADALDTSGVLPGVQEMASSPTGVAYVVGSVCVVVLLVVIWAAFIRKPKDERARHYRYGSSPRSSSDSLRGNGKSDSENGERKRRRRRRQRNPTLAETGGLPPRRDEAPAGDPP